LNKKRKDRIKRAEKEVTWIGSPIYHGEKERFLKKRSAERLVSFLGTFHRKVN